jgi:hypothetical protein
MTYIAKPKFHHPGLPKNDLGYTHRDYEGKISTMCAGCGHDSITARFIVDEIARRCAALNREAARTAAE